MNFSNILYKMNFIFFYKLKIIFLISLIFISKENKKTFIDKF
jgi:hypothetical protein